MRLFFASKAAKRTLQREFDVSNVGIFIQNQGYLNQLDMINLTVEDLRNIYLLQETVKENIDTVVEAFYSTITQVPHLLQIINQHSSVERLRQTLRQHLIEMFAGRIDQEFLNKRKKVALIHLHIGLYPKWYIAAFQNLQNSLTALIHSLDLATDERRAMVLSVSKILNFEQQIVLEEFDKAAEQTAQEQQEQAKKMVKVEVDQIALDIEHKSTESLQSVQHLSEQAQKLDMEIQKSIERSEMTKETSMQGMAQMDKLLSVTKAIEDETRQVGEMVQELNTSSQQIQDVISIVKNIAEQTNLLALNSAIEAARAGEHGRGFAVVAEEVRKLAEETKQSVEQIATLIVKSSEVSQSVVKAVHNMNNQISSGLAESQSSRDSFNNIASSIEFTIADIQDFSTQMGLLMEAVGIIGQSTEEVMRASKNLENTLHLL